MWEQLQEAVLLLKEGLEKPPEVGVVLGSGLGAFADCLRQARRVRYADIPHFPQTHVAGHAGELVLGQVGSVSCAVLNGRVHHYEGYSFQQVSFPVRVLAGLGIQTLVVTNAAGGINPHYEPGDMMVIADHINLTGDNPLRGAHDIRLGPRFPDMSRAYHPACRKLWHEVARGMDITLQEGIYASLGGPSYETPAEIRMLHRLGADAVGMSTVPEVIAARHMGLDVAGLSVITNEAAGLSPQPLRHADVTHMAQRVHGVLCDLLTSMMGRLARRASGGQALSH